MRDVVNNIDAGPGAAEFIYNYLAGNAAIAFGYTLITDDIMRWAPFG